MGNNYHYHHHLNYQQQQLQKYQFNAYPSGVIFLCNNITREECFARRIFGLPAGREPLVRKVREGMYLFLFDMRDRKMYGVFKAASDGGMNLAPDAFSSSGNTYPAQVHFNIVCMCEPLTELEFKPAIWEKYFTDRMFHLDLNLAQVQRLLAIFEAKKVGIVPESITGISGLSSTHSPLNRSSSNLDSAAPETDSDPNTEAAKQFMESIKDLLKPGKVDSVQPVYGNPTMAQTRPYSTHNVGFYKHPNDSTQQGVGSSSALLLSRQQEQFGYPTGSEKDEVDTQRMVLELAHSSSLMRHNQGLLHSSPEYQQFAQSAHNPLNYHSSQAMPVYAPNPHYPGIDVKGIGTSSNISRGSHYQGHLYHGERQIQEHRKSAFLHLGPNLQRPASVSDHAVNHPSSHFIQQSSQHTTINTLVQPIFPVQIQKLAGEDILPDTGPTEVGDIMELDPTTSVLGMTMSPDETLMPFCNYKRRRGTSKLTTEEGGDKKKRRLIRPSLELEEKDSVLHVLKAPIGINRDENKVALEIEGEGQNKDFEVSAGHMLRSEICLEKLQQKTRVESEDVVETEILGNSELVSESLDGTLISFCNYKRRRGTNKSTAEVGGDKKKRRLIRPSLELEEKDKVALEIEGVGQNKDIDVSDGPISEICPETLLEKAKAESEIVAKTEILGNSELGLKRMNIVGRIFSEGRGELLVLEENEQERDVLNAEPVNAEPGNNFVDKSMLEPEPDNSNSNLCSQNGEKNPVEESVFLEPEAGNLEPSIISSQAMLP